MQDIAYCNNIVETYCIITKQENSLLRLALKFETWTLYFLTNFKVKIDVTPICNSPQ